MYFEERANVISWWVGVECEETGRAVDDEGFGWSDFMCCAVFRVEQWSGPGLKGGSGAVKCEVDAQSWIKGGN